MGANLLAVERPGDGRGGRQFADDDAVEPGGRIRDAAVVREDDDLQTGGQVPQDREGNCRAVVVECDENVVEDQRECRLTPGDACSCLLYTSPSPRD